MIYCLLIFVDISKQCMVKCILLEKRFLKQAHHHLVLGFRPYNSWGSSSLDFPWTPFSKVYVELNGLLSLESVFNLLYFC